MTEFRLRVGAGEGSGSSDDAVKCIAVRVTVVTDSGTARDSGNRHGEAVVEMSLLSRIEQEGWRI